MALISRPGEFQVGSPPNELEHQTDEDLFAVRIDYDFAIATTEVTRRQYAQFSGFDRRYPEILKRSPDPDCPILGVNWFRAVR